MNILKRLEAHTEYSESSESRELRRDAAEEIRRLMREIELLTRDEARDAFDRQCG